MTTTGSNDHWHRTLIERRGALFAILTTVTISIGGLVEIVPLFTAQAGPEPIAAVQPYSPLEVAGRDIYVREGCYVCHSQMVRPMRSETLRYGEWSRAGEYEHDRPFQLGSRRIGPDLHRIGGKYPDAWHYEHMRDPRSTSPNSIMPAYTWLLDDAYDVGTIRASVLAQKRAGTPYTDEDVANVESSVQSQAAEIVGRLTEQKITTEPDREIVALIAYLQRLGVDGRTAMVADGAADAGGTP